jgi:cysteine desulfurase
MSSGHIYLDYNASTPIASEVQEAMLPYLSGHYGNPSSGHWASAPAATALTSARAQVASLLGANASEVFFTSGASESNNWAIKGVVAEARRRRSIERPHIVISAIEHPSVQNPCRYLSSLGVRTTEVRVDRHGLVDPDDIRKAIERDTVLVSVMHANNEVGTIQPITDISDVARTAGVICHTDAAQSVGKVPVDVTELGVDLLTVAGHKLYAPKGVGALFVRNGVELDSIIHGAGHERGRRAGTENVLFAVALGAASALAEKNPCEAQLRGLSEYFLEGLSAAFGERVALVGHPRKRLPNTVNVGFAGHIGADILAGMPAVAASTGSACHAGSRTMSSVLVAMGVSESLGLGTVRFSFGRSTTRSDLGRVIELLRDVL